jgi:DNA (cytosine-5)-methyltransferase 1
VKPWLLDTYCKAGGASEGYRHAGFKVTGLDIEPQPHYHGDEFILADALEFLSDPANLRRFDAIHASPPCQVFSEGAPGRKRDGHPDLLTPTRELLRASGKPYAIENVATAPMPGSILLCGSTLGLPLIRHRRFEVYPDPVLAPSLCHQKSFSRGVAHVGRYSYGHGNWGPAWRKHVLPVVWPWMTVDESGQAIPPAYTEYIGGWLLECIQGAAA